jgi:hypothetical protein
MGRDIHFIRIDAPEDDENRVIAHVSLGSGDAWPCYWRPFMIAGYRRIQQLEGLDAKKRQAMLDAILKCCPPSHDSVDNSAMYCGYNHVSRTDKFWSFLDRQKILDETTAFKGKTQLLLHAAGLWPIVELILIHGRAQITTPTIRRVAEMMALLETFVPYENNKETALAGTPYENVDEPYNLADERWEELIDAFKVAALDEDIVALIN